jgi:predicted HNH restriction endonuclease
MAWHHMVPVAQRQSGQTTTDSDLALVCANCHQVIHRSREVVTVQGLAEAIIDGRLEEAMETFSSYRSRMRVRPE